MKINKVLKAISVVISLSMLFAAGMQNTARAEESIITLKMSDEAKIVREQVRKVKPVLAMDKKDIPAILEELKKKNASLEFPKAELQNTLTSKEYGVNSVYVLKNGKKHDTAVIYIHGGGFTKNFSAAHAKFCDLLVDTLDADVFMPLYSLIPYGTYKDAFALLDSLYIDLLKKYSKIIIAGDSAGGNISLAYTLYRKEQKKPLPYKAAAYSPLVDMSMENPDIIKYAERDPMVNFDGLFDLVLNWKGGIDTKDYRVSPLYGNLAGLPDILLFFAQDGILFPDGINMYNKLIKAGNGVQLVIGVEHFHVFPEFEIPEQKQCLQILKDFCR